MSTSSSNRSFLKWGCATMPPRKCKNLCSVHFSASRRIARARSCFTAVKISVLFLSTPADRDRTPALVLYALMWVATMDVRHGTGYGLRGPQRGRGDSFQRPPKSMAAAKRRALMPLARGVGEGLSYCVAPPGNLGSAKKLGAPRFQIFGRGHVKRSILVVTARCRRRSSSG